MIICTNSSCGIIKEQVIDSSAEWRFYGADDSKSSDPTRCGLPGNALLPESSLGSVVGFSWGDTYQMRRIRQYQGWNAMPYKERALYNDFVYIHAKASQHGIPECIIEEAKRMYKKIAIAQISRGANRKGLMAASIYISCKKNNNTLFWRRRID